MEKTRRVETETRLEAAAAELERRLAKAQAETQTQTARVSEMTENEKVVNARVVDLETQLLAFESKLEAADAAAVDARRDAARATERAARESETLATKLRATETRLVAAELAAAKASEAAEMFKTQLKSAEADISAAATTSVGSARDAAAVTDLAGKVAALETDLVAAGAASARAEAELQASLEEYTAALASVSAREKAAAEELARAESRAKEAERRADALAARLAATLSDSSPSVIDSDSEIAFPLVALSRMKKPELVAELVARGLESDGIVAELRQRLRDARRRDGASLLGSPRTEIPNGVSRKNVSKKGAAESALKRPLSSYMLFAQFTRAEVIASSDARLSVGEVGKALGARWKATDAAEKKRWEEKARALKAAYDVALMEARAKDAKDAKDAGESNGRSGRTGTSYYKVVNGERYDRRVLDDCDAFQKVNGSVDLTEARRMYEDVSDGPAKPQARGKTSSVTDVEIATLEYALVTYAWTDEARAFVENKLREER